MINAPSIFTPPPNDMDMTNAPSIFTPPPNMPHPTLDSYFPPYSGLFESMSASTVNIDDFVSSLPSLTQSLSPPSSVSLLPSLLDDESTINMDTDLFRSAIGNEANGFQHYDKAAGSKGNACRNGLTGGELNNSTPVPSDSQRIAKTPTESIHWFSVTDAPGRSGFAPASDVSATKDCALPSPSSAHGEHSSRGCLARCLCLLDQLTPQWTAAPCTQNKEKSSMPTPTSFESVIAQNQAAADAVDDTLKCPCSRNSVLLFTLALVVFKILGWYAACANATPGGPRGQDSDDMEPITPASSVGRRPLIVRCPSQSTMLEYEMEIGHEDRIVCQIVLSRLYSVRRTLNVLTQRLMGTEEKQGTPNSSTERVSAATENLLLDGPAFTSSSPSNLGQSLASNLRCHLHELCQSIVKTLSEI
jgi:Aflatoxin regulatory protein